MFKYFNYFSLGILFSMGLSVAQAEGDPPSHTPSQYAVFQQQGPTCPHISWSNLGKVREMRERDKGHIVFQDSDFVTKIQSYAWFFPHIRALDRIYEDLRTADGDYAAYERALREEGVRSSGRYDAKGRFVDSIDWTPTNKARRENYTPYNIKVEDHPSTVTRWLPILQNPKNGELYYYSYHSNSTQQIPLAKDADGKDGGSCLLYKFDWDNPAKTTREEYHFTQDMLDEMGVSAEEISRYVQNGKNFLGSSNVYFLAASADETCQKEYFYDVGSYQHMLFACGLKADNTLFAEGDTSVEAKASLELQTALHADKVNPWSQIDKDDLFEYHLAELFKSDGALKQMAMTAVNFYNDPWKYYQEGFDLYDSKGSSKTKLSTKQGFMPGEDQMLAYYVSSQLRFLSASTISMEALISVEELEDELGGTALQAMKTFKFLPGVPSHKKVVKAALDKKYGKGKDKYSFLDAWGTIKAAFQKQVIDRLNKKDFVSFYGHGCVISFDDELVEQQAHEYKDVARALGFETWDSTYDGLNPFYRRPGKVADVVGFGNGKDEAD